MANKRERLNLTSVLGALSVLLGLFLVFLAPGAMQTASAASSPVPINCLNPAAYGYNAVELANGTATIDLDLHTCPAKDGSGNKVTYYLISYSAKNNAPYPSDLPSGGNPANYPQYLAYVTANPGQGATSLSEQMTVNLPNGTNACWQIDLAANSIPDYSPPQELTFNANTTPPQMTLPLGFFWGLAGPDSSCNSYGTTTTTTTTTSSTTTSTSLPTTTTSRPTTTTSSTTTTSIYVPHIYIPPPTTTTTTVPSTTTTAAPTTTTRPPATTTTLPRTTTTTVATKSRHSTTTTTAPPTTTTTAMPPTTRPTTPPTTVPKSLAYTGSDSVPMLAVGLGLILAGGVLLVLSTRQRRRHV